MATQKRDSVTSQPCVGPGDIRFCLRCGQPIADGQHWRKLTRDGYSVGVHDLCLAPGTKLEPNARIVLMGLRYAGVNAEGIPCLEVQP